MIVEHSLSDRPYHGAMLRPSLLRALASAGLLLISCSDPHGPTCCEPVSDLIVSDPLSANTISATASPESAPAVAPASSAADDVIYVSIPPGTTFTGSLAIIERIGDDAEVATRIIDGGFDPVAVNATTGDSIRVQIRDATGATVLVLTSRVRTRRPPVVVRTEPPRKKSDVPLNSAIVVVFSEPVAASTLTGSSVRLVRGTTAIAGAVRLLQGTATAAVFVPNAPLDANTDYRLEVTQSVRDLTGDALEGSVTIEFATGTAFLGSVASVSVVPDSLEVLIGSQFQFAVTAWDSGGMPVTGRPIIWRSADPSVVAMSATGLATALAEGYTYVEAEVDGQVGGAVIGVSAALVPIRSVTLTPDSARVVLGSTLQFVADIRDTADAIVWLPRLITWTSSDSTVATVTPNSSRGAMVTGLGAGIARISATVEGKSDTAAITIRPVASVVTPESATVVVYGTVVLSATLLDGSGRTLSGGSIAWRSRAPAVATVDSTGTVRGVAGGTAAVIATSGGVSDTSAITVLLVPGGRIAFWSERDGNSEIYAMNTDGSGVVRLTNDERADGGPAWSPDGSKLAFDRLTDRSANRHQIYVMNADGSQVTALIGGTDPAWSSDGARIAGAKEFPFCGPRWCTGTSFHHRIFVMNSDTSGLVVLTSSDFDREPTWSPDGRIAFTNTRTNGSDIFLINADGSGLTNLTNDPASDDSPAWSPDGTKIAFRSNRGGVYDLYVMNADGTGVTALTADSAAEGRPAWSPDGMKIAFSSNRDGNYEIYVLNSDGSGMVRLTNNPAFDGRPAWTP